MKSVTYPTKDGPVTVEYDETLPCILCGEPVIRASMSGTRICPWCDMGVCRYCRQPILGPLEHRQYHIAQHHVKAKEETMMQVINIRDIPEGKWPENYVYIGRGPKPYRSFWANPFRIGQDGDRTEVILRYGMYILSSDEHFRRLPELRDKVLVCDCEPLVCHGDVLAGLLSQSGAGV